MENSSNSAKGSNRRNRKRDLFNTNSSPETTKPHTFIPALNIAAA